jgi:outer membrane protein assembly factor BamB
VAAVGCRKPALAHDDAPAIGLAELQGPGVAPIDAPASICRDDAWTTYGHDAARTSASGGCVRGALRVAWRLAPKCATGCTSFATRAIADADSVFVAGAYGPVPTLWRADARRGAFTWRYDSHTECVRRGWPTLAGGQVILVDDGVNAADARTGIGRRAELDAWGESLWDGTRIFAENDWYLDGWGLYLSAFDRDLHLLWRRDYNALARGVIVPDVGGLAFDAGVLVHSAQHGPLTGSGLSAFDPVTGQRRWRVAVSPMSSPSIAGGRVFAIERWPGERTDRLAARSLADGKLLWARELAGARGPAPVLAAGLVVVHRQDAVSAFDAATGAPAWEAPVSRTADPVQSATTVAAALGSGTLLVLSKATLHVLRVDDGSEVWSGVPIAHARRVEAPVVVGEAVYVVADGAVVRLESAGAQGRTPAPVHSASAKGR